MTKLLVGSLVTFRLTHIITREDGPLRVFDRIRVWAIMKHPPGTKHEWIPEGLWCYWCMSFWIGLSLALIQKRGISTGLFYSAVASILQEVLENAEKDH